MPNHSRSGAGRHRPRRFTVSQPGAASVSYPSRRQARRVSQQLSGGTVRGRSGCLRLLAWLLAFAVAMAAVARCDQWPW